MAKVIQGLGSYNVKESGASVEYPFEYQEFSNLQDAIAVLGEDEALACIQRMVKVDANNVAREKAKVVNGHSTRKPMSEEEKAQAKAERAAGRKLLEALKAKGIKSIEELNSVL